MRFRPSRRALVIAGVVLGTLGVLIVVAAYVVYPRVGVWMVETKVVPRIEAKLGRDVEVGAIEIDHGHAVLRDVRIRGPNDGAEPLARIDRIDVDFDFWASVVGRPELGRVVLDGVAVQVRRGADGRDNVRDLLARFGVAGDDDDDRAPRARLGSLRPTEIELTGGTLVADDQAGGIRVTVLSFDGSWARGGAAVLRTGGARAETGFGPAASAQTLVAIDDPRQGRRLEVAGGAVTLWTGMALTGIAGTIAPADAGRFEIDLSGGYGDVPTRLWDAKGWIDPDGHATIDLDAQRFSLDRLRPILERSAVLDYDQATVDARLHVEVSGAAAAFAGGFHLHDFTVDHALLAEAPIPDLDLGGEIAGRFDRASRVLTVDRAELSARKLPFSLSGWLAMPGGLQPDGSRRPRAAVDLRFQIPPMPCQEVLDAIPRELAAYLQDFQLKGTFDTDLRFAIDWADLDRTVLDGRVGIRGCKARRVPEVVTRLARPFEHYVEVERDQWLSFEVGPDNPDFVPIEDVSPYLLRSLMTTEDSAFYRHKGFITREFRTALIKNLEAGYFRYGASSITMQLVKNVLLYREKTLARKLQELFLTHYLETVLDKDRIFEIYVNVIEYGPGIYGIGPAAWHYFGKHPRDLAPVEAAFFSSILPSPKERYAQYCKGTLRRWTEDKIARILALMRKRDRLTDEEYQEAQATPLVFAKDGVESEDECMNRRRRAMRNARSTNPLKKK
jgi:hypothetical protein